MPPANFFADFFGIPHIILESQQILNIESHNLPNYLSVIPLESQETQEFISIVPM